jgi:hypothetical protein
LGAAPLGLAPKWPARSIQLTLLIVQAARYTGDEVLKKQTLLCKMNAEDSNFGVSGCRLTEQRRLLR